MNKLHLLGRLMAADFLERVRRHSFLITLGFAVFAAVMFLPPNPSKYATLNLGGHRGIYNSAWVGALVALLTVIFLSLAGFYLVKNAIERDRRTGVGQILAATPMRGPAYLLGKLASNFAVLAAMVGVLAVAAGVMQVVRGEDPRIDPWALLSPFVCVTLPCMAVVAALAVCFEVAPGLQGSLGNLVYFILWNVGLSTTVMQPGAALDFMGGHVIFTQMQAACAQAFPTYAVGGPMTMGFNIKAKGVWDLQTFVWSGAVWTPPALAARAAWVAFAIGLTLAVAPLFDRFDPRTPGAAKAPGAARAARRARRLAAMPDPPPASAQAPAAPGALPRLEGTRGRMRLGGLVLAELRVMLNGTSRWWMLVALGLAIASLFVPLFVVRQFLAPFALVWPVLRWSPMGAREREHRTEALLFSTPRPIARLLVAQWLAGAAVALAAASGAIVRLAVTGEWTGLAALVVGVGFVPSLALALGTWAGTAKLFEVLFLMLWYAGPMNRIPPLDFVGATQPQAGSGPVVTFLLLTVSLLALAVAGRRRRLAR